jgi:hypothetical protein
MPIAVLHKPASRCNIKFGSIGLAKKLFLPPLSLDGRGVGGEGDAMPIQADLI